MSKDNFCNWVDANHFMMECDAAAGGIAGMIDVAQRLESPLEVVMLGAMKLAERKMQVRSFEPSMSIDSLRGMTGIKLSLRAAVPIGTYRADMVMHMQHKDLVLPRVVVECDGFTYHDINRDQAIRDRARDRYMQRMGYIVARFAGDEIVEQPFACAFEVFDLALLGLASVNRDHHPDEGWPTFTRGYEGLDIGPLSVEQFHSRQDARRMISAEVR